MRVIAYLGVASKILEFLLEEKVDLIVMSQKLSAPGVEYIPYMQEEFALVAPPDFREPTFNDKDSFEAWLCSQPWISYDLDLPIIRRFWGGLVNTFVQARKQGCRPFLDNSLVFISFFQTNETLAFSSIE